MNAEPRTLRVGIPKPGGGYAVTDVPMEIYVARVLAGESLRDSQPAALEALAITIRTFALANRGRHRADGFDLCDQTHLSGAAPGGRGDRGARRRRRPAVCCCVTARRRRSTTLRRAADGRRPSDVWPGAEDPPYCRRRTTMRVQGAPAWTAELHESDLQRARCGRGVPRGAARRQDRRAERVQGRVARLKLDGLRPGEISGRDLRVAVGRTLGWQHVKSTAFDLRKKDGSCPLQWPRVRPRRRHVRDRLRAPRGGKPPKNSRAIFSRLGNFCPVRPGSD
jgi:stage II sporulation protein D